MAPALSRRGFIRGAGAGSAALAAGLPRGAMGAPPTKVNASIRDFSNVVQDLYTHYWSGGPGSSAGHINTDLYGFASDASNSAYGYAQRSGVPNAQDVANWNNGKPDLWPQAQLLHLLYWYWRYNTGQDSGVRVANHFNWLVNTQYSVSQCEDASLNGPTIRASDDAAWNINLYLDAYDTSSNQTALSIAMALANSTYQNYNPSPGSTPTNGLYYAIQGSPLYSSHPNRSSLYEVGIANACLRIYNILQNAGTPNAGWLNRAKISYNWMSTKLLDSQTGLLYTELDLGSGQPALNFPGQHQSIKGQTDYFLGGTFGMAVLAANLYNATGNQAYLNAANRWTNAIINNLTETDPALNVKVLLNDRDPWTESFFIPEWASTVSPMLPSQTSYNMGVLLSNSATSILTHSRTSDGFYTADWVSGTYWSTHARGSSSGGQSVAEQMDTSATTCAILLANGIVNG